MAITKKNSSTRTTKASSPSSLHPPYYQMISEAITTMKDRTGSSQPAIAKFIEVNYNKQLPSNFKKNLSVQLKRFVKSEKLVKIKNSYKISTTNEKVSNNKFKKVKNSYKLSSVEKTKRTSNEMKGKNPKKATAKGGNVGKTGLEKMKKKKANK